MVSGFKHISQENIYVPGLEKCSVSLIIKCKSKSQLLPIMPVIMVQVRKTTDRKFVQSYRHTSKLVNFCFKYCGGAIVYNASAFVVLCLVKFLDFTN